MLYVKHTQLFTLSGIFPMKNLQELIELHLFYLAIRKLLKTWGNVVQQLQTLRHIIYRKHR